MLCKKKFLVFNIKENYVLDKESQGLTAVSYGTGLHFCDSKSIIARSESGDAPHNASR